jgi:branched-chain amino acid transport system permease protein
MGVIGDFIGDVVEVIVFGIQTGAIYSLVGLGLALVYKATRILNFAQGALGTAPAFVAYLVMVSFNLSEDTPALNDGLLIPATFAAIAAGAVLGILLNVLVVRRLANASPVTSLVATVGVVILFSAVQIIIFEPRARSFPRFVDGNVDIPLFDVAMTKHTLVALGVLAITAGALAAFFRTPQGVGLLATAQEPFAAELQGVPVARMRTLAWGAAGAMGGLAGVLGAGFFQAISPGFMTTTFLIPAFTGVVLGGITSMVGAVLGGFLIGITESAATKLVLTFEVSDKLPGPPQTAVLLVLLAILLFRPRGLLGQEA